MSIEEAAKLLENNGFVVVSEDFVLNLFLDGT